MQRTFPKVLEIVGLMRRSGVNFLVGTDAPAVPYSFPGFSVHDEMAMLVKAGVPPMESLQAATRNPANYLDMLGSLGTVERGKIADLVLLDANPLQDINNTQRIAAVSRERSLVEESVIR